MVGFGEGASLCKGQDGWVVSGGKVEVGEEVRVDEFVWEVGKSWRGSLEIWWLVHWCGDSGKGEKIL